MYFFSSQYQVVCIKIAVHATEVLEVLFDKKLNQHILRNAIGVLGFDAGNKQSYQKSNKQR